MLAVSVLVLSFIIGFGDAIELSQCPANLPRDQYLQVFNGLCYRFFMSQPCFYWEANLHCRHSGGRLALVKGLKERKFIANRVSKKYKGHVPVWIAKPYRAVDPITATLQHSYHGGMVEESLPYVCQYRPKYTKKDCPKQLSRDKYVQVHNDKCYRFVVKEREYKSFPEASKDCKKTGGSLVVIKSKQLNNYIANQLYSHYFVDVFAWIGLSDEKKEGEFVWEDGTILQKNTDFTNWALNEGPKHWGILFPIWDDYVAINPKYGGWFDHDEHVLPYVCQYNMPEAKIKTKVTNAFQTSSSTAQTTTTQVLTRTTETPTITTSQTKTTQAPTTTYVPTTTSIPTTTIQALTTTYGPATTTQVQISTTQSPITTTQVPKTTTQAPIKTTQVPITTTQTPIKTTQAPIPTTRFQITSTQAPTTTIPIPTCPPFICDLDCGMDGYTFGDKGCSLCKCDV